MKRLAVSTGEYACTWSVNGATVAGELEIVGRQRPRGSVFDAPGVWTPEHNDTGPAVRRFSPHTVEFPRLCGRLRTNQDVVLLDAKITHLFPEQARLSARMALCGLGVPNRDEPLFDSVEFQVGGLTELSGVRALKEFEVPIGRGTAERQFTASWNGDADQEWRSTSGDSLSLNYVVDLRCDRGYRYHVSSYPVVSVSGEPRAADAWMDAYVRPLAELASFATASSQPICWVRLTNSQSQYNVQVFAADITQEPYDAQSPEPGGLAPLLHLGPGGSSLVELLRGWQDLREDYDTFFDLLTTALREKATVKAQFLALVPAIESYHTTKYGDGPLPRREFAKERKAVLRRLAACPGVDDTDVGWLKDWVNTIGSYQLHDRLRQLFEGLPPELQGRLRERVEQLPAPLEDVLQNPRDVWNVMGKVRNNLVHGGDRPTSPQLLALTRLAQTLVIGLTLQQLGVADTALVQAIDRGDWQVM